MLMDDSAFVTPKKDLSELKQSKLTSNQRREVILHEG